MAVSRVVSGNGIYPTCGGCVAVHSVCAISLRTCEVVQKRSHRVVRQSRHVNTVSDIGNAPAAPKRAQEMEKSRGKVIGAVLCDHKKSWSRQVCSCGFTSAITPLCLTVDHMRDGKRTVSHSGEMWDRHGHSRRIVIARADACP